MRSSVFVALFLTLFTLLLVLSAAFIFLFQGRQVLEERVDTMAAAVDTLQGRLEQTESGLMVSEATRTMAETALATAVSDSVRLEGELVASQQRVDELTATLEALQVETSPTPPSSVIGPQTAPDQPQVSIVSPGEGSIAPPNEPLDLIVAAADPAGVTNVSLAIDGETIGVYRADDQPLFVVHERWTPPGEGAYTFSALATNVNGRASQPVTRTITVADVQAQNAAIRATVEANVVELRGLAPRRPVEPTFLTRDELRQRIEGDFTAETSRDDARHDALVLSAFDFLARDFDLYQAYLDLYGEGILGFYDPETAEFVVVSDSELLTPAGQWTHAHEFMHALQDQHFQLALINDDALDSEAKTALRALAEGEAELVQLLYVRNGYFTQAEVAEIVASMNETDTSYLEQSPPILVSNLSFPYTAGFEFVAELYRRGGGAFALIDAAWQNLPQSTEQILHPDRYLAGDAPQLVALPPLTQTLGLGWELLDEDILGEFFLREYLRQQLTQAQVDTAATGWGGDRYAVYWHEGDEALVMVLRHVWDTAADSDEFSELYPRYPARLYSTTSAIQPDGGECWQGTDVICLYRWDQETLVVRAPDVATAVVIAGEIRD